MKHMFCMFQIRLQLLLKCDMILTRSTPRVYHPYHKNNVVTAPGPRQRRLHTGDAAADDKDVFFLTGGGR